MKRPLDEEGTIGSKPCEKSLNRLLAASGDRFLVASVMSRYNHYRHGLNAIGRMPDAKYRKHVMTLWRDHFLTFLDQTQGGEKSLPEAVYTHLRCCMVACYRVSIKEQP
jgi:hypothetical protein